jgi:ribose 5-phosphate isomerase B
MSDGKQQPKRLLIASDHAGLELKQRLMERFKDLPWVNLGTNDTSSVDYPDFAEKLCLELKKDLENSMGVLVCGSGQGMAIKANRFPFVRAALCWSEEVAELSRQHNNANILCLGSRVLDHALAERILQKFLATPFAGGRHQLRVAKLD